MGGKFGVALGDLVAVAEQFCHKGRADPGDEVAQCGVARAEQVNAEPAQSHHDGLSVEVLAGAVAREEPRRGDHAAGGAQMGPVVKVVKEHAGEGFWHWDWFGAKGEPDLVPASVR